MAAPLGKWCERGDWFDSLICGEEEVLKFGHLGFCPVFFSQKIEERRGKSQDGWHP